MKRMVLLVLTIIAFQVSADNEITEDAQSEAYQATLVNSECFKRDGVMECAFMNSEGDFEYFQPESHTVKLVSMNGEQTCLNN